MCPGGELEITEPLKLVYGNGPFKLTWITPIKSSGLESLTIETEKALIKGEGRKRGAKYTVYLEGALNCWIRNCEFSYAHFSHIGAKDSKNLLFEGNYLHHGWGYKGKDGKYGYGLHLEGAVDCLVINNVFETLRHAMMVKQGASGNVFAYNYSIKNNPQQSQYNTSCDFSAHGGYPYMNLVEGNSMQFAQSSDMWGPAGPLQTFFRNKVNDTGGIAIGWKSHFPVIVGNSLERGGVYIEKNTIRPIVSHNITKEEDLPERVDFGRT